MEYVGHLISSTGTSFTDEKRLQVFDFPLPETRELFSRSCSSHDGDGPASTELIDIKKYKGSKKLTWTPESIEAFHFCRIAVSNCQELSFLEDTATPILQTNASDYGIGGYMYMLTNGQVRVIRFFSKFLI